MYKITESIKEYYDRDNIGIKVQEEEEYDYISLYYDGDNVKNIRCSVFVEKEEMPAVLVRLFGVCVIPEERCDVLVKMINEFNEDFKWAEFSISEKNELNISSKSYVTEENAGDVADMLCYFCVDAYDEVFAKIMSAIWNNENGTERRSDEYV